MEVVVEVGAGLDVHKKTVVVCCLDGRSNPVKIAKGTFGTFRSELEQLRDWLKAHDCRVVAMESTGVYWLPVFRVLEGHFEIVLGNARHMANVPGRKTDQSDAQWIAELLRFGLIRKNFIPPRPIFELRQLTREQRKLIQMRTSAELRVEKLLQTTNIKLSSVASEVFGVSGRLMLEALAKGVRHPGSLAELSRGKLRKKRPALVRALDGTFTAEDGKLLSIQLHLIDRIESQRQQLAVLIDQKVGPYEAIIERLDGIPGINRVLAIEIVAETGGDMSPWPSPDHFAAWCGVCPGNRESGGKRRPAHTRQGRPAMKAILARAAMSASHVIGSHLAARFQRLTKRRGPQHAVIAIAHEIAVSLYFMLSRQTDYQPPAPVDPNRERDLRRAKLIRQLQQLGYTVSCTK
jgi:transposase